jgi:hypothetical protein
MGSKKPSLVHGDEHNHHRPKSSINVESCMT